MTSTHNICAKLLNDSLFYCDRKPIGGIEQVVKSVNRSDIDYSQWTVSNILSPSECSHEITAWSGTDPATLNAVTIQGIPGKQLLNYQVSWADTDYGIYFTHLINLFSQGITLETLCNLKALGEGAEVVTFVEQKNKGVDNKSAFLVFGWYAGLKLADGSISSSENNGNAIYALTSKEPDLEPYMPLVLNITDYPTTKAFFDSL